MPTTVSAAFNEFLATVRTARTESAAAASHRTSINEKLKSSFGCTAFFRSGSFGNTTNVSRYSDVDYFAVIPSARMSSDSRVALAEIAAALRERFPTTQNIRVNSPGVQVPFGLDGAEATEIVPVRENGRTTTGYRQFLMPDGNGGWMFSAPESHNDYVSEIDKKLGYKVKPLIRFVKTWKFFRSVPVKSFYLEIFTTAYAATEPSIVYDIDVRRVFERLQAQQFLNYSDPRFPGKTLKACNTEIQRQDALVKLSNAAAWANDATAHRETNPRYAIERWNLVYYYEFPSFG